MKTHTIKTREGKTVEVDNITFLKLANEYYSGTPAVMISVQGKNEVIRLIDNKWK